MKKNIKIIICLTFFVLFVLVFSFLYFSGDKGVANKINNNLLTCAQVCQLKGYTDGYCSLYGGGPLEPGDSGRAACAEGGENINMNAKNCENNMSDGANTCCCLKIAPPCKKEGEEFDSSLELPKCCAGLTEVEVYFSVHKCVDCKNGACKISENNDNYYSGDAGKNPEETKPACAKEGEKSYFGNPSCCDLPAIPNTKVIDGQCSVPVPDGSQICANCGDGSCGVGENRCNCPKDCAQTGTCDDGTACGEWTADGKAFCDCKTIPGTDAAGNPTQSASRHLWGISFFNAAGGFVKDCSACSDGTKCGASAGSSKVCTCFNNKGNGLYSVCFFDQAMGAL